MTIVPIPQAAMNARPAVVYLSWSIKGAD